MLSYIDAIVHDTIIILLLHRLLFNIILYIHHPDNIHTLADLEKHTFGRLPCSDTQRWHFQ